MTLRTKTSLLLALLVIVALGVTGMLYLRFLESSLEQSIYGSLESVSKNSADSVGRFVSDALRDVQLFASTLPVQVLEERDVSAVEERLKGFFEISPKFRNGIFLLDNDGRMWADYPPAPGAKGKSFAFREYFLHTMAGRKGLVSAPHRSSRTNEPVLTFTAFLQSKSHQPLGLLGCSVPLAGPEALGGFHTTRLGRSGSVYVLDPSGTLILDPDPARILRKEMPFRFTGTRTGQERVEGVGDAVDPLGVPVILSVKRVPGTDWTLGAQQPQREAFAAISEARTRILLGIFIAVVMAILVGALAVRGITSPLVRLREAIRQFGVSSENSGPDGERFRRELEAIRSRDEIGELAGVFNEMSVKLDRSVTLFRSYAQDWMRTFDSVADAIYLLDPSHKIVRMNRSAADLFEVSPEHAVGRRCYELLHHIEKPPENCPHLQTMATGEPARIEMRERQSGRFFEMTTTPLSDAAGRTIGSVHVTRDITQSRMVEEQLCRSQSRYRTIFESATISLLEEDFSEVRASIDALKAQGVQDFERYFEDHPEFLTPAARAIRILDVNQATVKLYGAFSKEDLLGPLEKILAPESVAGLKAVLLHIAEGKDYLESESVHRTLRGERLNVLISVKIPTERTEFDKLLVSVVDITARKHAEQALRESEETARALLNAPTESAVLLDVRGTILALNQPAAAALGKSISDLVGACAFDLFSPELARIARYRVAKVLRTGRSTRFEAKFQGSLFDVIVYPVFDAEGKVIRTAVFASDVTERKELEEERIKTSKLEATGLLAGGIAHDFNNILTAILGNIDLARAFAGDESRVLERLEEGERACLRAKDLALQLLTFSKGGAPIKKPTSIAELVRDSVRFALSGSNVRCELSLPEDLWLAHVDEGQISQVIQNIVINAHQAMPDGGTLQVSAANVPFAESGSLPLSAGRYICIAVKDQGVGIPEEHLNKIFDPYFTTKQGGSGLGLSTVYSIVHKHGGCITVESEVGTGTTFQVYLSASEEPLPQLTDGQQKPVNGCGRILVMDDEEIVRNIIGEVLSHLGYEVVLTQDGVEAIEMYRRFQAAGERFDAVIVDLTIPGGMGGREVVQELIEMDPAVKAIASSGYSNAPVMAEYRDYGFAAAISKPFKIEDLSETLHKVLFEQSPLQG